MATQFQALGHGQVAITVGRNNGWSKHAKFVGGYYVGQHTKQTNQKRKK
jgi:hypothetical protein